MAKTLVIKDADFSTNKVTTVTFGTIPCTDISFSESVITITGYDAVDAEYTVTPADTTDVVSLSSSDSSVAVIENGKIKPVSLGSCAITATCGECSDTITVNVSTAYIPNYQYISVEHDSSKPFLQNQDATYRLSCVGEGVQAGQFIIPPTTQGTEDYPVILLPEGTTSITVAVTNTDTVYNGDSARVLWTKDESAGSSYPTAALFVSAETDYNMRNNTSKTFAVPEGADSFAFCLRLVSGTSTGHTPAEVAEGMGLSITFNHAS